MIGQFSGPYSPARTAKKFFVAKLLRDLYRQIFSNYIANSFILNCVLKRANDLKLRFQIQIRFAFELLQKFEAAPHEWYRCRTPQTHNRDIKNILLTSSSRSVPQVTDPRFSLTFGTDLELG